MPELASNNGTLDVLTITVPAHEEAELSMPASRSTWAAGRPGYSRSVNRKPEEYMTIGCNESEAVAWLQYELSASAINELIGAATTTEDAAPIDASEAIRRLLKPESLPLGHRAMHRRLRRLWRSSRLLLDGIRLGDLEIKGRLHAAAIATARPSRSRRLIERAFRRELVMHVNRAHRLQPSPLASRQLLDYMRDESGLELEPLMCSSSGSTDMDAWRALLTWFRDHFPYNRAKGEMLGNVHPNEGEAMFAASRTELQYDGVITRFPRFNAMPKILQTRQGRCGEYAQLMYQMVLALGWRARLVVDWTDHLWVEAWLPVDEGESRWVMLDPCEAAVDTPRLYAEWGKTHTYCIAIGDGQLVDVTADYARDWNATIEARDLTERQLTRAMRRARRWCRPPK